MIDELMQAIANGKHNNLFIAVGGGFAVLLGASSRVMVNGFIIFRMWLDKRTNAKNTVELCETAKEVWCVHIEGKVLQVLDETEIEIRKELLKVEDQVEHTNSLLENFITENQAEMNEMNNNIKKLLDKAKD